MTEIERDETFQARRAAARARLTALNPHRRPQGDETDPTFAKWYAKVYELADNDPASIPWAGMAPNPLLADWLERQEPLSGKRALDVGCGLGDNAELLAAKGASVTAFDCAPSAIEWAKRRFPQSRVCYQSEDLLKAPKEWRAAFDLVFECHTFQVFPQSVIPSFARALASFVAPGGRLLLITTARSETEAIETPWRSSTRADLCNFAIDGLALEHLEDIPPQGCAARHWRAVFRHMGDVARDAA